MMAGDFLELFPISSPPTIGDAGASNSSSSGEDNAETWDGIITCFFIDTARNIFEYLARIAGLLKPGV